MTFVPKEVVFKTKTVLFLGAIVTLFLILQIYHQMPIFVNHITRSLKTNCFKKIYISNLKE